MIRIILAKGNENKQESKNERRRDFKFSVDNVRFPVLWRKFKERIKTYGIQLNQVTSRP